jgi:hypothetical protein
MQTTQITVRNVSPILKRRIDKLAKLKSMSINDFVLDTLQDKVGGITAKDSVSWRQYSGLIDKAGINQEVLDNFETIDKTMWDKT